MQPAVPAPGTLVWIRQARWRVQHARRERGIVRLDVAGRMGRAVFLAPFDRAQAASARDRPRRVRPQQLLARLAGLLGRPTSCRSLASAIDAQIQVLPYQLEPALAILGDARRVLVADAVGLGKTIQAGLVIAELRRRQPALRALVIVPPALRRQWADEMRAHFAIDALPADAAGLQDLASSTGRRETPWDRPGVWLGSIDYLKQPHVFAAAAEHLWDLLVVDEAHGVCGHSERHDAAAALARRSRRVLLLSATPHSGDETKFERLLDLGALPIEGDALTIFRRTRADLGVRIERRVRWQSIRLTAAEERVLSALTAFEHAVLQNAGDTHRSVALLLLSVFRKRALSTMAAFVASIERRLALLEQAQAPVDSVDPRWRQPWLVFDPEDDLFSENEHASLGGDIGLRSAVERSWLRRLLDLGRTASRDESKTRRAHSLARRTKEPLVIFTEFRDSLHVLRRRIQLVREVAVLHGGLTPDEQRGQLERFLSGAASVLVATDVASQGLNLQSACRWVLNLELPWNPARLEQRAGRVDRIGQRRAVHVGLLIARHEAEAGLLTHLARRTLLAERRLGTELLGLTSDEAGIRAHLLTGAPLADPEPSRGPLAICTAWIRPARMAARYLRRQRALAAYWRGPTAMGRPSCADLKRLTSVCRWAEGGAFLCFSVPFLDGTGALVESRLAIVRVPGALRNVLSSADAMDAARRAAIRSAETRAHRLRRIRRDVRERGASVERALKSVLANAHDIGELQPGLFDKRALRLGEDAAAALAEIQTAFEGRLTALDAEAAIEIGSPILELAAGCAPDLKVRGSTCPGWSPTFPGWSPGPSGPVRP